MKFTIISPKSATKVTDEEVLPTQKDAGEKIDVIEEAGKPAPKAPEAKAEPKPEVKDPIEKEEEKVKPLEDKEIKSLRDLLKIAPKLMKLVGDEVKEAKEEKKPEMGKPEAGKEVLPPVEKKDAVDAEISAEPVDACKNDNIVDTCAKDSLKSVGAVENAEIKDSKVVSLADKEYAATDAMVSYYEKLRNSNN